MAAELFKVFQTYWQAGTDARLNIECHAGKVWMNLEVRLSHPPPPLFPHHSHYGAPPPHCQPARQSPSRLKRRAKCAEARAVAKAAVCGAAENVAVKDDFTNEKNVNAPATPQPNLTHQDVQQHHQVAEEAGMPSNVGHDINVPDLFSPDIVMQDASFLSSSI